MARERRGIELVRYRVDWVRGIGSLALLGFVGIAAIYADGWQGWALGAVFLLLAVAIGGRWWVRRDRYPRIPN
jgi:hypothetical protein